MDKTALFKACCKAIKLASTFENADVKITTDELKKNRASEPSPISSWAISLRKQITELRDYLTSRKFQYLNVADRFSDPSHSGSLSDLDRDCIERETEQLMRICNNHIKNFHTAVDAQQNDQQKIHANSLCSILSAYLKAVCKIYSELKAVRVKKTINLKKLSKLSHLGSHNNTEHMKRAWVKIDETFGDKREILATEDEAKKDDHNSTLKPTLRMRRNSKKDKLKEGSDSNTSAFYLQNEDELENPDKFEERPSSENRVQLSAENERLFLKLNSLEDEVSQLETKVVDIGRLQQVFSERVLEQDEQIFRINQVAIGTNINIQSANQQIREAIQRRAGMRVWTLFILLVLTFTIWFLDWYNP